MAIPVHLSIPILAFLMQSASWLHLRNARGIPQADYDFCRFPLAIAKDLFYIL